MFSRRQFLQLGSLATAGALFPALARASTAAPRVVIVGGGFGGATAAKYLRMWSAGKVEVILVERRARFVSCPVSNLVIGGLKSLADISHGYQALESRWGVQRLEDEVTAIDLERRQVRTAAHGSLSYDHLVLSPGIDFIPGAVAGLETGDERVPHAWQAGPQTELLARQLAAMEDGGVFALHIPRSPFRCPPGPYERACLVANYLRRHKPKSKVLVFDANSEIQSKKGLFTTAFASYGDLIEYHPNSAVLSVDAASRTLEMEFDQVQADVLNLIPPMRAADLALQTGLPLINDRWVEVDWLTLEAKGVAGVHVLGDALFPAPTMPKSGHMANQHGKVAAAAILNQLADLPPNPVPLLMNTCYSFVDDKRAMHVASVHQFDPQHQQPMPVEGAGGVSLAASTEEGLSAHAWAQNIWADMLA